MHVGTVLPFAIGFAFQHLVFATSPPDRAQADALFNKAHLLQIKIAINPEDMNSLKRQPRICVPATISEGGAGYTNVLIRLRGSAGSFRPVNDKPGLTIKIEKGAPRFHGLKKFHLNNCVQDRTYLN